MNKTCSVCDLDVGDFFLYRNRLYIKVATDSDYYNIIPIGENGHTHIEETEKIIKVRFPQILPD